MIIMKIKFTSHEVINLIVAFIVISLGFSISATGRNFNSLTVVLPIVMIGAGLGFILHEIGHKISAIHYGYWAEFNMWPTGLIISLISSFAGILIALPGAVNIYGSLSDRENGVISVCGPLVNLILAVLFIIISHIYWPVDWYTNGIIYLICNFGYQINAYLAFFNLLPIGILDGAKVLRWNPVVWIVTIGIAGILAFGHMVNITF